MSNIIRFPGEKTRRSKEQQADIDYETIFNLLSSISSNLEPEEREEQSGDTTDESCQTRSTEEISMDILDRFRRGREIMTDDHENTPSTDTDSDNPGH